MVFQLGLQIRHIDYSRTADVGFVDGAWQYGSQSDLQTTSGESGSDSILV